MTHSSEIKALLFDVCGTAVDWRGGGRARADKTPSSIATHDDDHASPCSSFPITTLAGDANM